jgi:hypothetical protein
MPIKMMTHSITTLNIMTLSIMILSIMLLSIMSLIIMAFSIMLTQHNDTKGKNDEHNNKNATLSITVW